MMKKAFVFFLSAVLLFGSVLSVCAAENPGQKLTRGVVNIISAPIEIAKQIDTEWKASEGKQVTVGIFTGLVKGLAYTVARMGSGAWDIISFPFKVPNNYDPIIKPEFVLDKE